MSLSVYKPNPFTYPGYRLPGVDPSHPASKGMVKGHGFSAIMTTNGSCINLVTGAIATLGTPTGSAPTGKIDGYLGPVASWAAGNNGKEFNFSGNSTVTETNATFACILNNTLNANVTILYSMSTDGAQHGPGISNQGTGFYGGIIQNVAFYDSTIPAVQSVPVFFAGSCTSSGNFDFVLANLNNGKIQTSTVTGIGAFGAPSGTYAIGGSNSANQSMQGYIAAAMFSPSRMSLRQLVEWAADPWAFWYPRTVTDTLFDSLSPPPVTDTLFAQAAL